MEKDKSQPENHGKAAAEHTKDSAQQERNSSKERTHFTERDRRPAPRKFAGKGDRRPRPDFNRQDDDRRPGRKPWESRDNNQDDRRPSFTQGDRKPRSFNTFAPKNDSRDRRDFDPEGRKERDGRPNRDFKDRPRPAYKQDRQGHGDFEQRRPRRDTFHGDKEQRPRQDYEAKERRPRSFDDRPPRFQDRERRPSYNDRERRPSYKDGDRRPHGDGDRRPYGDRDRRPYAKDGQRHYSDNAPKREHNNRDYRSSGARHDGPRSDYRQGQDWQDRPPRQERSPRQESLSYDRRPSFTDKNDRSARPYREDRPRADYARSEYDRDGGFERRPRAEYHQDRAPHSFDEQRPSYENETASTASHEAPVSYAEQAAPIEGASTYSSPLMEGTHAAEANFAAPTSMESTSEEMYANQDHDHMLPSQETSAFTDKFQDHTPTYFTDMNRPFGRGGRGARGDKRPPLRETVMNMDKDLLKMLARRCNILGKMKAKAGHLEVREEKEIRASWEKSATQMTRDPRIIHQLFALMQEITFSAKPEEGMAKRSGFNLAPPALPVNITMQAPLISRRSRLFLAMAGASGSACTMAPSLLDNASVECIKMFNQCATSLAWDDSGTLISREGGGLSLPDKVIFVGDDILNFFLLLGHYVSQNSRAKFTGESALKKVDLTAVRSFLPQLGARLSNVMPHSSGFPIRLECSGILPEAVDIPEDVPADFVLGLLLAAPFWENAISFDLRFHPEAEAIMEEALAILTPCKAKVRREDQILFFIPSNSKTPAKPELGMDLQFAAYILALPLSHGGQVHLEGIWPTCPLANDLETCLQFFGLTTEKSASGITAHFTLPQSLEAQENAEQDTESAGETSEAEDDTSMEMPLENLFLPASPLWNEPRFTPLLAVCTFIMALRHQGKKRMVFPSEADLESMEPFFNHLGFEYVEDGFTLDVSRQRRDPDTVWTAPTPAWSLAFALAATVKSHIKLSNPGIMTNLYPQFWNLYNALPSFDIKKNDTEQKNAKPVRRRIIAADQERTGSGDSTD